MASAGQTSTQEPQSTQSSAFTSALSSFMEMATAGHSSTQVSQPVQAALFIIAVMKISNDYAYGYKKIFDLIFSKIRGRGHLSCRRYQVSFRQSTSLP